MEQQQKHILRYIIAVDTLLKKQNFDAIAEDKILSSWDFFLVVFFFANLHKLSLPNTYDSSSRIVIFIIIHALRTQLDGVRTHSILRSGLGRAFLHTYSLTHSRTHSHSPNRWRETESKTYTYVYYIYTEIYLLALSNRNSFLFVLDNSISHTHIYAILSSRFWRKGIRARFNFRLHFIQ